VHDDISYVASMLVVQASLIVATFRMMIHTDPVTSEF